MVDFGTYGTPRMPSPGDELKHTCPRCKGVGHRLDETKPCFICRGFRLVTDAALERWNDQMAVPADKVVGGIGAD